MNKERILAFINAQISESLVRAIRDDIYAAYARSDDVAKEELQKLGPERYRAYTRRELCNDALARHGEVRQTDPKGEQYGFLQSNALNMLVFCVDRGLNVRQAKHRDLLSEMNKVFSPVCPDLFDPESELVHSSLHTCLMVVTPKSQGANVKRPEAIVLTVPYTNYEGFHLIVNVEDWLNSYAEKEETASDVWPTFREELLVVERDNEEDR